MEQEIQVVDINSCYEVLLKDDNATENEVHKALHYIHYIADGTWDHEWFYTEGDYPCFMVDLTHLGWKSPLYVPFDQNNDQFEEGTITELHEYCLLVDFLMRSKEFKRDYTHLENQFNYVGHGKPRRELNCMLSYGFFWHPVNRFDALYRCIIDDDPIAAIKRQISLIKPDKRPFIFYMYDKYLRETSADEHVIGLFEKCLLLAANDLNECSELPEDVLVHTSEGTFEPYSGGLKSSFPLEAVKISWDRTRW